MRRVTWKLMSCEEGLAYANDESEAEYDELEADDLEQIL